LLLPWCFHFFHFSFFFFFLWILFSSFVLCYLFLKF
jgi:hypothetical protein